MLRALTTTVLRRVLTAGTVALLIHGSAPRALGQAQAPPRPVAPAPHAQIPRVSQPPRIEDYLASGARPGLAITDFKQRQPKDLEPATEQTTAYLAYDAANIYVAFVCRTTDRTQLRARMAKRESIFSDDFVGIMLDTFSDKQRAYLFFVSPLGIQADGVTTAGSGDDYSFDTDWHTEGRLTDAGYVTWMAIPFKALRFPVTDDHQQHWGMSLMRSIPAKDEIVFWPAITDKLNGFVSQFGVMDGLDSVSPGRNVQLIPYATFTGTKFLDPAAAAYTTNAEGRAGLDAKFVAHDALTFDFTVNPDFSQVESDDPQVTVNQRFEVFFPEKRPFFLENSDIFNDTPQTLFFSRRIRDPQFGARMTGKAGRWALGAIAIDDRQPGQAAAPGAPGSGDRVGAGVLRARYDFSNTSRVGLFGTYRQFGPSSNTVGSADTRIKLGPKWFFTGQSVFGSTTSLTGVRTSGASAYADVSRSGRAFTYQLSYSDASPNFRTQMGFIPRSDYRQVTQFMSFRRYPKTGLVRDFGPNSFVQATWNFAGDLEDWIVRIPFQLDLRGQTSLFGRHALITEHVAGIKLAQHEDLVQFNSSRLRWMDYYLSYNHGTRPNYSPATGLDPFLGTFTDVSTGLTFRPKSALLLDETIIYSRLDARADSPGTGRIFSNPILRSRVNYQFSREWSLRAILDYASVTPNPVLVALDRSRHAGADVLLTWLPHPGTALYVGYTDGYDNLRIDPVNGVELTSGRLAMTGRQVFVKVSRLIRF
jgi:hypothetical protein